MHSKRLPARADLDQLRKDLEHAIYGRGLYVLYQPVFDAGGEKILGVEALCRWRHPTRGDISPMTFIPLAEEMGLIAPLGAFVTRQACAEALNWPDLRVAVNVSPRQFQQGGFVESVRDALSETGLQPTQLELEITESHLIENVEEVQAKMQELRRDGVRLALDDFGSGYSSLNYLLTLPFDKLKVDRSFVVGIHAGPASAAIIHAIVSIGRALGMHVTAEGVETAEQQQFLRVAGVHSFQGFRFSRPVAPETISEMLAMESYAGPKLCVG